MDNVRDIEMPSIMYVVIIRTTIVDNRKSQNNRHESNIRIAVHEEECGKC